MHNAYLILVILSYIYTILYPICCIHMLSYTTNTTPILHPIPYYYYHSSCIHLGAGKGYTWEESSKVIDIKVHIDGVEKREILTKRDIEVEIL